MRRPQTPDKPPPATQLRPLAELDAAAGHQPAAAALDARARKPPCFSSNSQSGWSKGSGARRSDMGRHREVTTASLPRLAQWL